MSLLIKGGRILDPGTGMDGYFNIFVEDGAIKRIFNEDSDNSFTIPENCEIVDACDCFVMPGLIDLHVHLRDPGFVYKESIETGGLAAARGGFTTICCMPNTKPVIDCDEVVGYILEKAQTRSPVNILPIGAVTLGQEGQKLADYKKMKEAGIIAVSEDGKSVMDISLYRKAMIIAAEENIPVMAHCEEKNLVGKGAIHKSTKCEEFGVEGISHEVEDIITARDILLARETGARLHLCHCSTKTSVLMVKAAKADGVKVTAEVCPHHFTLSVEDFKTPDTNLKMNPPLRDREDVEALIEGLRTGVIDAIATDHAPHHEDEKKKSLEEAPFGIVGLETAVPLTVTFLLNKGAITPMQMAERMSYSPAKIIGIDKGILKEGKTADITIINPYEEFVIDKNTFLSKGKNTPFDGWNVKGKVKATIVSGKIVYREGI